MILGAIAKIAGGLLKKVIPKGTIVGNLLGSTLAKKSKTMNVQPTATTGKASGSGKSFLESLGISGGLTFGGNKLIKWVIGAAVFLGVVFIVFVMRKRKRRR